MEELQARHRQEKKELQGKITSKKKNATKKTRKGINDECDRLEQELKERQRTELNVMEPTTGLDTLSIVDHQAPSDAQEDYAAAGDKLGNKMISSAQVEVSHTKDIIQQGHDKSKKPNRQKARLARRAAEQEVQIEAAAEEASKMPDQRKQELSSMKHEMQSRGLIETLIRPDGHCLYSACAQTIPTENRSDYKAIRIAAADFMKAHSDDFAPFMEESVDSYTQKIKNTAEWGGHLELQAIAKAFNVNINVLQASGHIEKILPESPSEVEIWLAYYKHSFGLGEHYNALKETSES